MKAAAQYEGASDTSSLVDSRRSLLSEGEEDSPRSAAGDPGARAEIEALIREVVPDEIDNIDEMLTQFKGREQDLINTLRTMQDQKGSPVDMYSSPGIVSNAPSGASVFESDSIKSGSVKFSWGDDSSKASSFNNGSSERSDSSG